MNVSPNSESPDGTSLEQLLKQHLNQPISRLLDYAIQAAKNLENARRQSIIHGDIKPGNLILDAEGGLKVINFALPQDLGDDSELPETDEGGGTPHYSSPEQGMGRSVDHRSDIYSLGATLYELITHQPPFDGDTPLAIMMKHINSPLTPPATINPQVPAEVSDIVMRMMAKEPAERYQDYEPLIRDLESARIEALSRENPSPPQPLTQTQSQATSPMTDALTLAKVSHEQTKTPEPPRQRVLMSATGAALIAAAAMFLFRPVSASDGQEFLRSWIMTKLSSVLAKPKSAQPESNPELLPKSAPD